jgi:prepilin-type N-terminal cleavage/methylation domain-containing protein
MRQKNSKTEKTRIFLSGIILSWLRTPVRGVQASSDARNCPPLARGFTLIELILVMALLTVAVSVTAPALSNFFRGRSLDSEARRLLAMTRGGQNRAVSEGLPMDLWLDTANGKIGLEAEPSFEKEDSKRTEFELDTGVTLEVVKQAPVITSIVPMNPNQPISVASVPRVNLTHANLPTIRFLPDGTLSETSPEKIKLSGRDGSALWLVQARDKLSYQIRSTDE